jgi:BirA family biotin operon repressor/biotin-[acetyl-CoA-carboxylase] ligase
MARYQILEFAELDSTNRHACSNLHDLADGDIIQAMVQTNGHGRLDRRWISHIPGNLCISIVLKPNHTILADLPFANLSQLLSLSVCHSLDAHGVTATIKWPNDLLVDGRKIAGLLAESVVRGAGEFMGFVLGLGVNLNLDAETMASIDQPATSLAVSTGRPVNVVSFRDAVLNDFFDHYDSFLERGFPSIREEYTSRCLFIGTDVTIRRGEEIIHGRALELTSDGALEITTPDGVVRQVELGEMIPSSEVE